jgi:hypothetical protein
MSLLAKVKADLGGVSADIEKLLTSIEPEMQAIAEQASADLFAAVQSELPALETALGPVLGTILGAAASGAQPAASGAAAATAIVGAVQTWLTSTLAKKAKPSAKSVAATGVKTTKA